MKPSQLAVAVAAVLLLGAAYLFVRGDGGPSSDGGGAGPQAPEGAVVVPFAYSPEKEKLLKPLIARFNAEGRRVGEAPVFIEGQSIASGEAEAKIARGRLRPVAWSPASSLWGRLLNFEADRSYAAKDNPSIVRTPVVIAMWEPLAKALGYPRRKVGYDDILRLATSKRGWAAVGAPQFGPFKLVHTNPDFSTSGLSAVVSEYYSATGKKEGLTEADVENSAARSKVRGIERSIVHYGDTTLFIADQMRRQGIGYTSAVTMEEVTLLDFNRNRGSQPKLVAVYPEEGTFYSDNPLITLDAPWVSPEEREGAKLFERFLGEEVTPRLAAESGFRPGDVQVPPEPPLTQENGVDPAKPTRVLGLPEPRVLDRIRRAWREDRKPANVLLVLDTSGSMSAENRLEEAKRGLEAFFREVSPNDRVGLTAFSDQVRPLVSITPFRRGRGKLRSAVTDLFADGGTAVFDATDEAVRSVQALRDRRRINAVVVLTDGEDTDSSVNVEQVAKAVDQGDSSNRVRVFTIAYSAEAVGAADALERIAVASGGKAYTGDTEDIEAVYRSISSFF